MKDIPGLPGYQVSEAGQIQSVTNGIKKLTPNVYRLYLHYVFKVNGKRKGMLIHRAVALTYIPNPYNKAEVNHIDGNKLNNHVSNLEWCTHSENMKHAFKTGLANNSGGKNGMSKILLNTETGIYYETVREAAKSTGWASAMSVTLMLCGYSSNRSKFIYA